MLSVTRTTAQSKRLLDLFNRVKQTGKPVRIESGADTFYVLSAEQLLTLLGGFHAEATLEESLQPEEFGLTQDEIAAYEERRAARRKSTPALAPLDAEIQRRLLAFGEAQAQHDLSPQHLLEQEYLLNAIENALLRNLVQTVAQPH